MNCRTAHYELSLNLDGRLPSGRHAMLMEHVDGCGPCATLWKELQAAQSLALRMPRQRVSSGFRDQLWQRIQSGEGTPEAVFREPVPLVSKVRYVLAGAAAAAAVLLALDALQPAPEKSRSATEGVLQPRLVARGDAAPGNTQPTASYASLAPLTPDLLAREAALQFRNNYVQASSQLAALEGRQAGSTAQGAEPIVRSVCDHAVQMHDLGSVLLRLREDEHVTFSNPQVDAELRMMVQLLDEERLSRGDMDTVRTVVAPALRRVHRIAALPEDLRVRGIWTPAERQQVLMRISIDRPQVIGRLFYVMPGQAFPGQGVPVVDPQLQGRIFVFQDDCGTNLVAPRSTVANPATLLRLGMQPAPEAATGTADRAGTSQPPR